MATVDELDGTRTTSAASSQWSDQRSSGCPSRTSARWSAGGSLMTISPPDVTSRLDECSVVSGGPNPRAVTASNASDIPSTSPAITDTRSRQPSRITARRRKSVRLVRRSISTTSRSGRSNARTRPGTPPPEPISATRPLTSSSAVTNARACSITSGTGRSPKNPRRWLSRSTVVRSSIEASDTCTVCHHRPAPLVENDNRPAAEAAGRSRIRQIVDVVSRERPRSGDSDRHLRTDSTRHLLR